MTRALAPAAPPPTADAVKVTAGPGASPAATGPPGAATRPRAAFSSVMQEVARTAHAEGQKKTSHERTGKPTAGDQTASDSGTTGVTGTPLAAALAELSAQPGGVAAAAGASPSQAAAGATDPAATGDAALPLAGQGTGDAAGPSAGPGTGGAAGPSAGPGTGGPVAIGLSASSTAVAPPAGAEQPTPADPHDQSGSVQPAPAPDSALASDSPPAPPPDSAPAQPAASPAVTQPPAASSAGSHGRADPTAGATPPVAAAPSRHEAPSSGGQPAATPAQPSASTAQPQSAPAQSQSQPGAPSNLVATPISAQQAELSTAAAPADAGTALRYGVGLEHAVETVRMTVELGAKQGLTQARIQLSPASLGGIRIQLSQTSDGLVARVVAEHSAAAQTLQQNGAELRRSLESTGIALLRLDIESSDQQGGSAQDPARAGYGSRRSDSGPSEEQDDRGAAGAAPSTIQLANGAVVNVLA